MPITTNIVDICGTDLGSLFVDCSTNQTIYGEKTFLNKVTFDNLALQTADPSNSNTQFGYSAFPNATNNYNGYLYGSTAFGSGALSSCVSGGYCNTAVGTNSLFTNQTGSSNTAIGYNVMYANVTGKNNTACGFNALSANTTNSNTAIGNNSLPATTTGTENTATGNASGFKNTTGSCNTLIGAYAAYNHSTASNNTAVGHNSLRGLLSGTSSGINNTAVGYYTSVNVDSSACTFLGAYTGANNNYTSSTAIGYGAQISASNQIVLGTSTEKVVIPGTTTSTSTSTGALVVSGGVGIGSSLYMGGQFTQPYMFEKLYDSTHYIGTGATCIFNPVSGSPSSKFVNTSYPNYIYIPMSGVYSIWATCHSTSFYNGGAAQTLTTYLDLSLNNLGNYSTFGGVSSNGVMANTTQIGQKVVAAMEPNNGDVLGGGLYTGFFAKGQYIRIRFTVTYDAGVYQHYNYSTTENVVTMACLCSGTLT